MNRERGNLGAIIGSLTNDLSSSDSSLLDNTRLLRFMGDVRVESFFGVIFDFESLPLDGRDVLLLFSTFLIDVGDEFLLLVFVGRSNGGSFGLAILVIANV